MMREYSMPYWSSTSTRVALAIGHPILVYKEFFAVRRVDEAVTYTVHRFETQVPGQRAVLCCHFVNDIRIGVGKIVIRVILLFHRNAHPLRVGIVKEKDSTQKGTFSTPCVPMK